MHPLDSYLCSCDAHHGDVPGWNLEEGYVLLQRPASPLEGIHSTALIRQGTFTDRQ